MSNKCKVVLLLCIEVNFVHSLILHTSHIFTHLVHEGGCDIYIGLEITQQIHSSKIIMFTYFSLGVCNMLSLILIVFHFLHYYTKEA